MSGVDNIIAALEQRDRVCDITLNVSGWMMDAIVPAMLGQFPALKSIVLDVGDSAMVVVPSSFLGGSAPQPQWLTLYAIPFPALPTLLSSTKNLVSLELSGISRSGYISPEAMVTFFSAMPKLGSLRFQFESPQSFPDHEGRRYPPLARSTLPALGELVFEGVNEYFEDFVARIDTPMICILEITFLRRHFYNFSQLSQLMGRVEVFKSPARADIRFFGGFAGTHLAQGQTNLHRCRWESHAMNYIYSFDILCRCSTSCYPSQTQKASLFPVGINCGNHNGDPPRKTFCCWIFYAHFPL